MQMRSIVSDRTQLICDDSVRFFQRWVRSKPGRKVDLVYLDSYDLNPRSPYAAAVHGVREYLAIRPALGKGSLLLADDTSIDPDAPPSGGMTRSPFVEHEGVMPGKGM